MATILQGVASEVADNWPAFLYLTVMTGFSIRFLSERRAETRVVKQIAEQLRESVHTRFDRLEYLLLHSNPAKTGAEDSLGKMRAVMASIPEGE